MKLIEDQNKFDGLQMSLKWRLGRTIFECLESARLEARVVDKLCDDILFAVTEIIDAAGAPIADERELAHPVLAFTLEDKPDELIVVPDGGTSWMHEYVVGTGEYLRKELEGKAQ